MYIKEQKSPHESISHCAHLAGLTVFCLHVPKLLRYHHIVLRRKLSQSYKFYEKQFHSSTCTVTTNDTIVYPIYAKITAIRERPLHHGQDAGKGNNNVLAEPKCGSIVNLVMRIIIWAMKVIKVDPSAF